jgi:hypothetical protein
MVSSTRLRAQGLRFLRDRYQFTRAHVQALADLDVGGDIVVEGDASFQNVAMNIVYDSGGSPVPAESSTLRVYQVSSIKNVVQTVRINNVENQQEVPFLCAHNGFLHRLSLVWITAEVTKGFRITLSDGKGFQDEVNELTTTFDGVTPVVGDVDTKDWVIEGNKEAETLALFNRGDVRWLHCSDSGITGPDIHVDVVLEISPTYDPTVV